MGRKADELGRTLDADTDAMTLTARGFDDSVADAESAARALEEMPADLGMGGLSAEAANGRLSALARNVAAVGRNLQLLRSAAESAQAAVRTAQREYRDLPDGELSFAERGALTAGGTVLLSGVGAVTATVAGGIWSDRREQARERAAATALAALGAQVGDITLPRGSALDDYQAGPISTEEGAAPSDPTTARSTPRGYSPAAGATGGGTGVRDVGSVSPGAPGVGSSWQPPVPTGLDPGLGGGSTGGIGGPGSGSGSSGTVGTGGGPAAGDGPGIGGVVPGSGDGSSSDGLVGGTVPGSAGAGGGFLGGPGASGSGTSGVGAGGLAGGLTVGGAALGAASLNRMVGGTAGAGGLGSTSGIGGTGGARGGSSSGGTFAAGGRYGAGGSGAGSTGVPLGTSGSGLSGSTSALGQGSQSGASAGAASGARSGGSTTGGPMGGGGGAGASKDTKRRASGGLLAPNIEVEEGAERPDLGAGAGAGGRDALHAPVAAPADAGDNEW